jgi:EAL domain-containing protein (putative c-di-GMP-specific phosphodiesterase class I)
MSDLITVSDIESAIERVNGFFVATYNGFYFESLFQPIVSTSGECLGFEALVRIKELKTGEIINPHLFFQSQTSDIEATNFGTICFGIHVRNFSQSSQKHTTKLFLNIMPTMLSSTYNSTHSILDALGRLRKEKLSLDRVVFEVTEFKSHDLFGLLSGIEIFRAQGIRFAIDDFGIDSSNEERVMLLKPDFIKLDKSLLDNFIAHSDTAFIEAIKLTEREGANVIIEGVETKEQLDILANLGVDFIQGYYFGKPEVLSCA